jgi:hypothetical protein
MIEDHRRLHELQGAGVDSAEGDRRRRPLSRRHRESEAEAPDLPTMEAGRIGPAAEAIEVETE